MDHLTPVKTALLVQRQALSACRVKVRRSLSIYQLTPRRPASPPLGPPPPPAAASPPLPLPISLLLNLLLPLSHLS